MMPSFNFLWNDYFQNYVVYTLKTSTTLTVQVMHTHFTYMNGKDEEMSTLLLPIFDSSLLKLQMTDQ